MPLLQRRLVLEFVRHMHSHHHRLEVEVEVVQSCKEIEIMLMDPCLLMLASVGVAPRIRKIKINVTVQICIPRQVAVARRKHSPHCYQASRTAT